MNRPVSRQRRSASLSVYLLFFLGLIGIVTGIAYPAEAFLNAATPESLVTSGVNLDRGSLLLGGTLVVLGACSIVIAELLILART
ncbi:hypothetical protein [Halogeometricum borinquense]|uniref:hypothetical protein n=1 Tax=Halogeometricum borinquense TaxID=60847 RepID=UPI001EF98690|nr:hypothetical protein [Halogeometricum borinquense]